MDFLLPPLLDEAYGKRNKTGKRRERNAFNFRESSSREEEKEEDTSKTSRRCGDVR